ncbi:hypothetical protein BU23DRAFT_562501 [Bimuria novae-zelandiae CBS 107.79]|uniref:Uncharacterized protein n=1 Tax=Bimuria novae-zelandiae CBS 107.79 TaxID=1447943 RepID=A0A6A5VT40_9PLEO|nr:hypothetical protein BU23DRAFT_562501 [Bimuria novae-zelandiae CBS 107.79]
MHQRRMHHLLDLPPGGKVRLRDRGRDGEPHQVLRRIVRQFFPRSHRVASKIERSIDHAGEVKLHASNGEEDLPFHRVRSESDTDAVTLHVELSEPVLRIGIDVCAEERGKRREEDLGSLVGRLSTRFFVVGLFVQVFVESLLVEAELVLGCHVFFAEHREMGYEVVVLLATKVLRIK